MNWAEFEAAAPELATYGRRRIEADHLVLLGTLRSDGWPRISPNEAYLVEGELTLGMMWRSTKARDLLRDPRLTVTTTQCDREAGEPDLKLYGTARDLADPRFRKLHADAQEALINWRPEEPYHLFVVDIESAGYISFGSQRRLFRWTRAGGLQELRHPERS